MDDTAHDCPLCCEELDISDQQFFPCKCGYQVCMWCWHRIRESESGLCPACRTPYGDDPHEFSAVDVEEVLKANKEKEAAAKRERQQRQPSDGGSSDGDSLSALLAGNLKGQMEIPRDRTQLANMRVIRRNLVYAVGLPPSVASEDMLRKADYFGQYGKISKIVLNRSQTVGGDPRRASASAYVTFLHKEDTLVCILALDGFYFDGRNIRASYGTSKYCSAFIKNVRCNNPECTYLHQMGDVEDTFTKQEIQAGYVTSGRDVLARQQQIVQQALSAAVGAAGSTPRRKLGGGGPSGTGRASSSPVFPVPSFDEPQRAPTTLVPPPPATASMARSLTTGSGFPTISAANAAAQAAAKEPAPAKIVRSSSAGGIVTTPATGFPGPTPKGSIGSAAQATRKSIIGGAPGATAASVVAGMHSVNGSSEPPAPHTTLTPLTPLKRATGSKGAPKAPAMVGSAGDPSTDLNMPVPKGLTHAERTAFLEQRRETMANMARQQTEMATKLTSLRGAGKKQSGKAGSAPGSPSASAKPGGLDGNVSLIGGAVIAAPVAAPIRSGPVNGVVVGVSVNHNDGLGLGGLGGEIFMGPLKSSGNKAAIGGGATIGGGKDKWNSTGLGGDPVFSGNTGGFWTNSSSGQGSLGLGAPPGANQIGGGIIGGSGGFGGSMNHGSSALASMLGISLPQGPSALRDNSTLWCGPGPPGQPPIAALNGSSVPMQGVIGSGGMNPNNGLIGGVTIGGGGGHGPPMSSGTIGTGGGNKSDIALLQSLLPGVHITGGSHHQSNGFGTIGGGGDWGGPRVPNQAPQRGGGGLRIGEPQQPAGHWGGGIQPNLGGAPVGAVGQGGAKQNQGQAPGSIW